MQFFNKPVDVELITQAIEDLLKIKHNEGIGMFKPSE